MEINKLVIYFEKVGKCQVKHIRKLINICYDQLPTSQCNISSLLLKFEYQILICIIQDKNLMGILGLRTFLLKYYPAAIRKINNSDLAKKRIAIDASNWMYKFLIKTQSMSYQSIKIPMDRHGNQTGHLIGMMSRVAYCLQNDIKSIWVFDGKPPEQKLGVISRRKKKKQESEQKLQQSLQLGQPFHLESLNMSKRSVKISEDEKKDAEKLIQLTGLPIIRSPSEAQSQCAAIVKLGLADLTISEDVDTIAFGCPKVILKFKSDQKGEGQCQQAQLDKILSELSLTYEQFLDFSILLGCDYSSKIKNIGPVNALKLLKQHKNIEGILNYIASSQKSSKRYTYQDDFNFLAARRIFTKPEVSKLSEAELSYKKFNIEGVKQFLIDKDFKQERVDRWLLRVRKTGIFQKQLS